MYWLSQNRWIMIYRGLHVAYRIVSLVTLQFPALALSHKGLNVCCSSRESFMVMNLDSEIRQRWEHRQQVFQSQVYCITAIHHAKVPPY